ncbi:unnamed protein product [Lymnaea stagnalis]|uniref:Aminopeptidase n=1 Tax=Lymnaea stagnalis TaxID=6523 RepID=A0AAV2IAQ8_LYMST
METEAFPDVTLADTVVMEHRALNSGACRNDGELTKDTLVVLKPKRRRYQISRNQIILCACVVALIVAVVVVVTVFLIKHTCSSSCSGCKAAQVAKPDLQGQMPDLNPSESGSLSPQIVPFEKEGKINSVHDPWSSIRLPRSVIPLLYEMRLKVDLSNFFYEGSVNITLRVNTSTRFVIFHRNLSDVDNSSILLTSPHAPSPRIVRQFQVPEKNFHVLEVDRELEASSTYILTIGHYSGPLQTTLRGLYLSSYETRSGDKRYLSTSQLQPTDARKAFPCFDEPDMKARFKLQIIYQPGYTALTNMPAIATTSINSDWLMTEYAATPVMSTYLLAVIVCDFKPRNYTFDNGYELKMWAREEAFSQTEYAMDFAIKTYNFFTDYFGMPDIVPKADHVAVPDYPAGAMENWGLVVYRETSMLYDRLVSSSHNKYTVTLIVAHEIAHTWFGNMVTMAWWDDLWLNEGFASLLMYLAMDKAYPQWNVFAIQIVDEILPAMVKDALTTSRPVSSHIADPDDIPQHFDTISYSKGMAILRMIMAFAGAENFRDGVRHYVERFKFKNAEMSQLWSTLTESFNGSFDVGQIMDTWTRQMGYPVVTVEDGSTHYTLHQSRFLLDHNIGQNNSTGEVNRFGYKWYIPFTYVTQEAPNEKKTIWMNLGSASIPKYSRGWLLGNYEFVGFFRVMYDKNMWDMLAEQLITNHTVLPEANRAVLIGDAFAFARASMLEYDVALNITRYLKKEQSYIPWEAFLHSIEFLRGMIANNAAYVQLQHYLRNLVAPVFEIVGASDKGELPEKYLRRVILSMACDVGVEKAVEYAKSMFANWMKHDTRLPPDLSMVIYSVGIREGGATEWDYVWNKTTSTSVATEGDMMMESLVYTQKPWLLWRYINWLLDSTKIRNQDVRVVIGYFSKTPLSRMVAIQFVMSQWNELVARSDIQSIASHSYQSFPTIDLNLNCLFEAIFKENTPRVSNKAVENALALIR